ncbi:glycosyl transferase family 1 [Amycolatopsis antarctica]|uniref:Glycosyl transferase family 1 n=1 Tax=Amycolatopsis antarctica TaxID=1854586 RepID=A0A263CV96_9PSEU|nr:glycosyltransferase family 4 protein [Amycolatopsis antarctica]OZM70043.1 glycosyl transferase family 1 [Amycolatopsis antarctica]
MTTMRTAGVLTPSREVAHHFELLGWTTGIGSVDEVDVRIGNREALVSPAIVDGAPEGAFGWRAEPERPVPSGTHPIAVSSPPGAELTTASVTVGRRPGEEPLWIGELEAPTPLKDSPGNVVMVVGWALLDSRAPSLVEVMVEGGGTVRARTRLPRPDAAEVFGDFGEAAISGFEARVPVELPPGQDRQVTLRVRYRTAGVGEWISPATTFTLSNPPADPDDAALSEELGAHTRRTLARVSVPTDPRHLLIFTHSLALGGGQLWLQELLGRLVRDHDWQATLVTETDGPLRADCEELGVGVHLTTHYRNSSVPQYEGHVGELARLAKCSGAGVALINTLGGFPAADAAIRAGIPTAWVIHESFSLPDFAYQNWGPHTPPAAVWSSWESALAETDMLLFVADATREMFLPYSKPERCRTVRYGTPMAKFGGRTRAETRWQARQFLKLEPEDTLLVNIGVVESRKGQGPLIAAMEPVRRAYPNARLSIVGYHASPYGKALAETIERDGLGDWVDLVPIQRDPTPWLHAADVFVNSSDIESLPRSILEAVCCGIPVAATDVFGAREMITDGESGWLFETGDVDAITAALLRVLDTPAQRRQDMAQAAYRKLADWLPPAGYAREYSDILSELAAKGEHCDRGSHQ